MTISSLFDYVLRQKTWQKMLPTGTTREKVQLRIAHNSKHHQETGLSETVIQAVSWMLNRTEVHLRECEKKSRDKINPKSTLGVEAKLLAELSGRLSNQIYLTFGDDKISGPPRVINSTFP